MHMENLHLLPFETLLDRMMDILHAYVSLQKNENSSPNDIHEKQLELEHIHMVIKNKRQELSIGPS